ncbi:carbohydrate-binding protein [Escherichia coli]|uniref:gp53-like domain-containing protein n=1 Tax=Escherichia coli TaxID=562 RepID=UPI001FAA8DC3|nr:carbohydrate-binding protein [Escherichia coli]EEX2874307.1 carbohydrate-binding protein [Escherichia coli]MCI4858946.1 carbohydrate-binding protein [Escherichia coli]
MSKITRYEGNLRAFGSDAQGLERTLFGETSQADDLTSQVTASFLRGWGIVGASEHPSLEDFNAAMYAMSQFIAYQHQMGVPEWHAEQEYYLGSICTHNGESYQSLGDANVGNEPPSAAWTPILTARNGLANLGLKTAAQRDVGTGATQIPDMAAFSSGTGWLKLPNGKILQWGAYTGAATSGTINFPIPFITTPGRVVISMSGTATTGAVSYIIQDDNSLSLTSFHWKSVGTQPRFNWFCIGE